MADAEASGNANPGRQGQAIQGRGARDPAPPAPQMILLSPWDGDIDLSQKTGKALWCNMRPSRRTRYRTL